MRDCILAVCLVLTLIAAGCKGKPVPPEAREAELQEKNLWRAGAQLYAAEEYDFYLKSLRKAKEKLIEERAKLPFLQDFQETQKAYREILTAGEGLLEKVAGLKQHRSEAAARQIASTERSIATIKKLTGMINQGRFARTLLIRAELKLREASEQQKKGEIIQAEKKLTELAPYLLDVKDMVFSILERYQDPTHLDEWEGWMEEAIRESEKDGIFTVVVIKIDRSLVVYSKGKPILSYVVGLGPNSLADKVHAGDYATPEGKYHIVKKNPTSKYHKALLLDYPNEEDKKRFQRKQQEGLIPPEVEIGGLIELHGGGGDSITNGCISIEDEHMDKLFDLLEIGTPVTIIGSTRRKNQDFFGDSR